MLAHKNDIPYQLRSRTRCHQTTLINKTKFLNDTDILVRVLLSGLGWIKENRPTLAWRLLYPQSQQRCIKMEAQCMD